MGQQLRGALAKKVGWSLSLKGIFKGNSIQDSQVLGDEDLTSGIPSGVQAVIRQSVPPGEYEGSVATTMKGGRCGFRYTLSVAPDQSFKLTKTMLGFEFGSKGNKMCVVSGRVDGNSTSNSELGPAPHVDPEDDTVKVEEIPIETDRAEGDAHVLLLTDHSLQQKAPSCGLANWKGFDLQNRVRLCFNAEKSSLAAVHAARASAKAKGVYFPSIGDTVKYAGEERRCSGKMLSKGTTGTIIAVHDVALESIAVRFCGFGSVKCCFAELILHVAVQSKP